MNYDFENGVFPNLRRTLRDLGEDSRNIRIIKAYLSYLPKLMEETNEIRDGMFIHSSSGVYLDLWGVRLDTRRNENETDEIYRTRLLLEFELRRAPTTLALKKLAVARYINKSDDDVHAYNLYRSDTHLNAFRIGRTLGRPIPSRKYILYHYAFEFESNVEDYRDLFLQLDRLNLGGNIPLLRLNQGQIPFAVLGIGFILGHSVLISRRAYNGDIFYKEVEG